MNVVYQTDVELQTAPNPVVRNDYLIAAPAHVKAALDTACLQSVPADSWDSWIAWRLQAGRLAIRASGSRPVVPAWQCLGCQPQDLAWNAERARCPVGGALLPRRWNQG